MLESWEKPEIEYLTPTETQRVILAGRLVPHVEMIHLPDGQVHLSVGTHGFDCDMFEAEQIVRIVAQALALGAGFVGWPEPGGDFVPSPFAPIVHQINTTDKSS